MLHSWQYSRYRRPIMQGAMWLILGATVGLAALQARQHSGVQHALGMPVYAMRVLGPWHVRVPVGWVRVVQDDGEMVFREPIDPEAQTPEEQGGRELHVQQDRVGRRTTSATYLAKKFGLEALPDPKLIPMCGQQGVIFTEPEAVGEYDGAAVIAGTVRPNGEAVAVLLRVRGELSDADSALAQAIATTITYQPGNPSSDGKTFGHPKGPDGGD